MNWKNWPYWLKGGTIGGGVTLVFVILLYTCIFSISDGGFLCLVPIFISPMFPVAYYFDSVNAFYNGSIPFVALPVVSVLLWFIVGSLIGKIVGIVKKGSR